VLYTKKTSHRLRRDSVFAVESIAKFKYFEHRRYRVVAKFRGIKIHESLRKKFVNMITTIISSVSELPVDMARGNWAAPCRFYSA
jgi:hypothetical protein